jgi:hypothetical protein
MFRVQQKYRDDLEILEEIEIARASEYKHHFHSRQGKVDGLFGAQPLNQRYPS